MADTRKDVLKKQFDEAQGQEDSKGYKNVPMLGQDLRNRGDYRFNKKMQMHPDDYKTMVDIDERDKADIERGNMPGASAADKKSMKEAMDRQNRLGANYDSSVLDITDTGKGFDNAPPRRSGKPSR